jgi:hypothetical protein
MHPKTRHPLFSLLAALTLLQTDFALAATAPLTVTNAAAGNQGRVGERYDWTDSRGKPRQALLARNNVSGGGMLDRFVYTLASNAVRTVNATTGNGADGFGYVVSHLPYVDSCAANPDTQYCHSYAVGVGDSPLGNAFTGTYSVKFAGRHHAIHEFKTTYPRFTGPHPTGSKFIRYDIPVTIQWMFANGRDHPLWMVTWDWSAVPASLPLAEQIEGDARGPYGEMNFDGDAGSNAAIGGVAWAVTDKRFTTSSAGPLTLNSPWTWTTTGGAAIPYNMLWIQNANAQMGIVQTSLVATHDAGNGGYLTDVQNTNSSAANTCTNAPGYKLLCVWNWPYQSIENNFYDGGGNLSNTVSTNGRRLAWGAKLGAVGRSSYQGYYTASNVAQQQAKSYSTFIVLGEHSATVNPVNEQVGELQRILKTSAPIVATASVGTLATSGPAGIARPAAASSPQSYTRAGYNPVYATWDVIANANKATLNWAASGADTLKNPVLRVLGYSAVTAPTSVTFNGAALVADSDYLASVDAANNTLWITLMRTVAGASNLLAINEAPVVVVPPPCTMDIDGDGAIHATTDGLILMRVMLGMTGTTVSSAAVVGAPRSTWTDIKKYLNESCVMGLP